MAETNPTKPSTETGSIQEVSPSSPPSTSAGVASTVSTAAELVTPTPSTSTATAPSHTSEAKTSLFKSSEATPSANNVKVEAVTPDASHSSTSTAAVKQEGKKVYREEVLGRYVLIEFLIDVNRRAWFRGQILKYQLSWSPNNNPNKIEHFVRFDDGDERWFALVVEEEMGRLQWTIGSSSSAATLPARKGSSSSNSKRPATFTSSIERKRPKVEPASEESVGESGDEDEDEDDDVVDDEEEELLPYEERVALLSKESESEWMDDMRNWLESVPHGRVKKVVSPSNASKVMSQVSKLVAGKGITYKNWPSSVCFYGGVRINLSYDFDKLLKVAKDFEVMYGEDKGHGWLLRHPIQKMGLYKEYRLSCNE